MRSYAVSTVAGLGLITVLCLTTFYSSSNSEHPMSTITAWARVAVGSTSNTDDVKRNKAVKNVLSSTKEVSDSAVEDGGYVAKKSKLLDKLFRLRESVTKKHEWETSSGMQKSGMHAMGESQSMEEPKFSDDFANSRLESNRASTKQDGQILNGMQKVDGPKVVKDSKFKTLFPSHNPENASKADQSRQAQNIESNIASTKQEEQMLKGRQKVDGRPKVVKESKFKTRFPSNNPVAASKADQLRQTQNIGSPALNGAPGNTTKQPTPTVSHYPLPFKIWVFWFGPKMSGKRLEAFQSMHNLKVPIEFVTMDNITRYERREFPFHPVIRDGTLSSLHVGDYMRAYFMYFYGGGYHDIKHISKPWRPYFSNVSEDTWVLGVPDSAGGIACSWEFSREMGFGCDNVSAAWRHLVCNSAYIMRARTPLAHEWITKAHAILDEKREELRKHPAPYARCCYHRETEAEKTYPLAWAHLHGDLFHPLQFKYNQHVKGGLPFWDGSAYRGASEGRMD